jgi:hypothetical protein
MNRSDPVSDGPAASPHAPTSSDTINTFWNT